MATIEIGDLFVVTRGFELNDFDPFDLPFDSAFDAEGNYIGKSTTGNNVKTKRYDRSYEGDIFLAIEICGPMIAARRIIKDRWISKYSGKEIEYRSQCVAINTLENEVWPVTDSYAKNFNVNLEEVEEIRKGHTR